MELKVTHLKALKTRDARYDLLVGKGLALRVAPSGRITFRYIYRLDGKQRVVTVGAHPANTLQFLRGKYLKMAAEVSMGVDPAADIRAAREAKQKATAVVQKKKAGLRVAGLIDQFLAYMDNPRTTNKMGRPYAENSKASYHNHLNNYFNPKFGKLLLDDVDARDISAWLEDVAAKAPAQSNRILATVRVMFGWAVDPDRGYLKVNPASGVRQKYVEQSKTRALDYDEEMELVRDIGEVRMFWNGLEEINPLHKLALQMVLLTGQRPSEVRLAKWTHFPEGEDLWVIPAAHTKNKKVHKIPLTPRLKKHLDTIRALSGHKELLFPRNRCDAGIMTIADGNHPMSIGSMNEPMRKRFPDMPSCTAHDLRRTTATHLLHMGVSTFEVGQILNHSFSGVTGIYARGSDLDGMSKNLNKWHRRLDKILGVDESAKVVAIR